MNYIELKEKDIIAKGGERTYYLHPEDKNKGKVICYSIAMNLYLFFYQ